MPARLLASLLGLSSLIAPIWAAFDLGYGDDSDLTNFVTRPELRVPIFEVDIYEPDEVTPGYWFVAPYGNILQESHARRYLQSCQTGPTIYDSKGGLIWTGACTFANQNACDFRAYEVNGTTQLSSILSFYPGVDSVGKGVILDSSFNVVKKLRTPNNLIPFNMHEFNVINNGKTAMHIVQKTELADVSHLRLGTAQAGLVVNMGIREFDVETGEEVFLWWTQDHINLNASSFSSRKIGGPYPDGWDWIHLNAVDKNDEGDYLVTARYTDAVYKVSSKGELLWSLGGTTSSFVLDGFNFSKPHDGRFVSSTPTTETITLLDNGGDEYAKTSNISSALIIDLDKSTKPWTAKVRQRWLRPDGGQSEKRGNFQLLPNGNAFVGWSENAYISEHSPDGRVLMEAQFVSDRFVTYRAYKFNFTGTPTEPPRFKGIVYGSELDKSVSVFYTSWNGATEVDEWAYYDGATRDDPEPRLLGRQKRTGFETMFQTHEYAETVYADAIAANGRVLGRTATEKVEHPPGFLHQPAVYVVDREEAVVPDPEVQSKEDAESVPVPVATVATPEKDPLEKLEL